MKHKISYIATLFLTLPLLCGCGGKENTENGKTDESNPDCNTYAFREYNVSRTFKLKLDKEDAEEFGFENVVYSDTCSIMMPEVLAGKDVTELRDTIMQRVFGKTSPDIDKFLAEWAKEYPEQYYEEEQKGPMEKVDHAPEVGPWARLDNTFASVKYFGEKLFIYEIAKEGYWGGAHGLTTMQYINYYIPENKFIDLDDLFTVTGLDAMPNIIAGTAMDNHPDLKGILNIESLPASGTFYISVNTGELVFVYAEYEVGPYALGNFEVGVPYWRIEEYLTPFGKSLFR